MTDDQGTAQPHQLLPSNRILQRLADQDMQAEVRRCLALLGDAPTDEQWKMILSPATATVVIAGAGSGKSSSLILRMMVLHKCLRVSLEEMHVFSFTKASTRDFQARLAARLAIWEERVERRSVTEGRRGELRAAAERVVSTFHSIIYRLRPAALASHVSGVFDMLKDRPSTEEEIAHFNPFVMTRLSAMQQEVLTAAHTRAYSQEPVYRALVARLLEQENREMWMRGVPGKDLRAESEPTMWEAFLRQEQTYHGFDRQGRFAPQPGLQDQINTWHIDPYRAATADRLRELGIPFVQLAPFPVRCPISGGRAGQMYAAFQVGKLLLHIERYSQTRPDESGERKLSFHERDRRKMIALYSECFDHHKVLVASDFSHAAANPVLTPDGDLRLQGWVATQAQASSSVAAPSLRVKLPGDVNRLHLAELLYREGTFLESLGLEVGRVQLPEMPDLTSTAVAHLLPLYWHAFQDELEHRRLLRFHDILATLRDPATILASRDRLGPLQHILVDEYQDVSPEIVEWLVNMVRTLAHLEGEAVSITGIGDDWQAIYGWRGCHPRFLREFARYFPAEQHLQVTLQENFRSRQPIIDAAEALLEDVRQGTTRHGRSALGTTSTAANDAVALCETRLFWMHPRKDASVWHVFSRYVGTVLHALEAAGSPLSSFGDRKALSILVLGRTRAMTSDLPSEKTLGNQLIHTLREVAIRRFHQAEVKVTTYHGSKGLEADFVLLLGDPRPPEHHPLREALFRQAPFLDGVGTYLQNASAETRRLGYVALTRARFGVLWTPRVESRPTDAKQDQQDAYANGRVVDDISPQGCFMVVNRFVQSSRFRIP